jgi:hypothetical protein
VIEQQAYTLHYSFQDYFLLHFANAEDAHMAQNLEFFGNIRNVLNSDAIEELMQKMKLDDQFVHQLQLEEQSSSNQQKSISKRRKSDSSRLCPQHDSLCRR